MSRAGRRGHCGRAIIVLASAILLGLGALGLERFGSAGRGPDAMAPRLEIYIDGLPAELVSRFAIPVYGWTLELRLAGIASPPDAPPPRVRLHQPDRLDRAERMTTIAPDDLARSGDRWRVGIDPGVIPLEPGRLSIDAFTHLSGSQRLAASVALELRHWAVGPPIGSGQIVHFDFEVDRDGDGRADFERDLENFGLASPSHPELAARVAKHIAEDALARARRAYHEGAPHDGEKQDEPVALELRIDPVSTPDVTRICVGGEDPSGGHTVGNVRFDPANADRGSSECELLPPTGLFPGSLLAYREDALFRAIFDPLIPERGGVPIGEHPLDEDLLKRGSGVPAATASDEAKRRRARVEAGISTFAAVLGTIMVHETGHALGLVAPGPPGAGLFGGREGHTYAHGLRDDSDGSPLPRLMDPGSELSFADLAGRGDAGELRFHPLHHAYLRDRIVLEGAAAPLVDRREDPDSAARPHAPASQGVIDPRRSPRS